MIAARRLDLPLSSDFHTKFHAYSQHYSFGLLGSTVAAVLRLLHNRCDWQARVPRWMSDRNSERIL